MYSRQVQSLFKFGSRHKEGIEHGNSLREHGDLQLMLILKVKEREVGRFTGPLEPDRNRVAAQ